MDAKFMGKRNQFFTLRTAAIDFVPLSVREFGHAVLFTSHDLFWASARVVVIARGENAGSQGMLPVFLWRNVLQVLWATIQRIAVYVVGLFTFGAGAKKRKGNELMEQVPSLHAIDIETDLVSPAPTAQTANSQNPLSALGVYAGQARNLVQIFITRDAAPSFGLKFGVSENGLFNWHGLTLLGHVLQIGRTVVCQIPVLMAQLIAIGTWTKKSSSNHFIDVKGFGLTISRFKTNSRSTVFVGDLRENARIGLGHDLSSYERLCSEPAAFIASTGSFILPQTSA